MHVTDLSPSLEKYKGMWVALTGTDTLISANKRAKSVYQKAVKKGYKNPILFKVPQHDFPHMGIVTTLLPQKAT